MECIPDDFPPTDPKEDSLWYRVRKQLLNPGDENKKAGDKPAVAAQKVLATPLELDNKGRTVTEHAQQAPSQPKVQEYQWQVWYDKYARKEDTSAIAKRIFFNAAHIVNNHFEEPLPIVIFRNKGAVEVRTTKELPKRTLLVPLFARKATSVVMEGENGFDAHKTMTVKVSWDSGSASQLHETRTIYVKEEMPPQRRASD